MKFLNKLGWRNGLMLVLCVLIIVVAETLFLQGNTTHALFIGLWVPTILGFMIYLKLVADGS